MATRLTAKQSWNGIRWNRSFFLRSWTLCSGDASSELHLKLAVSRALLLAVVVNSNRLRNELHSYVNGAQIYYFTWNCFLFLRKRFKFYWCCDQCVNLKTYFLKQRKLQTFSRRACCYGHFHNVGLIIASALLPLQSLFLLFSSSLFPAYVLAASSRLLAVALWPTGLTHKHVTARISWPRLCVDVRYSVCGLCKRRRHDHSSHVHQRASRVSRRWCGRRTCATHVFNSFGRQVTWLFHWHCSIFPDWNFLMISYSSGRISEVPTELEQLKVCQASEVVLFQLIECLWFWTQPCSSFHI